MSEFNEIVRLCQEIAERDVRIHDLTLRVLDLKAERDEAVGLVIEASTQASVPDYDGMSVGCGFWGSTDAGIGHHDDDCQAAKLLAKWGE